MKCVGIVLGVVVAQNYILRATKRAVMNISTRFLGARLFSPNPIGLFADDRLCEQSALALRER